MILLLIIFSSIQASLFLLFEQALGHVFSVFASLAIIGFLFFGTPFRGKVQTLINSIILKDKYFYQDIISSAARAMSTILRSSQRRAASTAWSIRMLGSAVASRAQSSPAYSTHETTRGSSPVAAR